MTASGIDLATFRLTVSYIKHLKKTYSLNDIAYFPLIKMNHIFVNCYKNSVQVHRLLSVQFGQA